MNILEKFRNIPIDNATIYAAIGDYNFPRNKVATMEQRGELIRLKNGLFVVSPEISRMQLSQELIANHLYGPSYISFETALAFYGLIPEKVFAVRSATLRHAKQFENSLGRFEYIVVPQDYYAIGINQQTVKNQYTAEPEYTFLIATPEKALCDLILATRHLNIKSKKAMQAFLEDNLRIDFSVLQSVDTEIIEQCVERGRKKNELELLLNLLIITNLL
jgi:predicted transcriptional regulator of viral defense system